MLLRQNNIAEALFQTPVCIYYEASGEAVEHIVQVQVLQNSYF